MTSQEKRNNTRAYALVTLALAITSANGCGAHVEQSAEPVARFDASLNTRADFGIEAWEADEKEGQREVRGFGSAHTLISSLRIDEIPGQPEQLKITSSDASDGEIVLGRDGRTSGAGSERLQRLAVAMSTDLDSMNKAGKVDLLRADDGRNGGEVAEQPQAVNDRFIAYQGYKNLVFSLWGYAEDRPVDGAGWCQGGYTRTAYSTQIVSGANASCWFTGWLSEDPYDCRAMLHVGIAGWRTSVCQWFIYQNGPDL